MFCYLSAELLERLAKVHLHRFEHHHHVLLVLQAAQQTVAVAWCGIFFVEWRAIARSAKAQHARRWAMGAETRGDNSAIEDSTHDDDDNDDDNDDDGDGDDTTLWRTLLNTATATCTCTTTYVHVLPAISKWSRDPYTWGGGLL